MSKDSWDIALVVLTGLGALFTGVAAVATAFAARGAYKAADVALEVANAAAQRDKERYDLRAEVHAAYIFNQVVMVYGFADQIHSTAELVKDADKATAYDKVSDLAKLAHGWRDLLDKVRVESIAELPDECAAATAGAISSIRHAIEQIETLWEKWQAGKGDLDRASKIASIIIRRCIEIRSNFGPYLKYARDKFGSEIE
jgi:hypothetical protein